MGFISDLFKKNKKNDESSKEYAEFLEKELENLKEETNRALEKERQNVVNLKSILEAEQAEKLLLQNQMKALEENGKKQEDEAERRLGEMADQLKDFENNYDASARVLELAKKEADQTVNDAKAEAKKIKDRAKVEAMIQQKRVESEAKEKYENDFKQFSLARERLIDCLNTLNQSHNKLVEAHSELGELISRMPIQIDDLFKGETFDFLLEKRVSMEPEDVVEVESIKMKHP